MLTGPLSCYMKETLSGVTLHGLLQNPELHVVTTTLRNFFKSTEDHFKQFYLCNYNEFVIVQSFSFCPNIQMSLGLLFHQLFSYSNCSELVKPFVSENESDSWLK